METKAASKADTNKANFILGFEKDRVWPREFRHEVVGGKTREKSLGVK